MYDNLYALLYGLEYQQCSTEVLGTACEITYTSLTLKLSKTIADTQSTDTYLHVHVSKSKVLPTHHYHFTLGKVHTGHSTDRSSTAGLTFQKFNSKNP